MPSVKVRECIGNSALRLRDTGLKKRWPNDELLKYLNAAQKAIVMRRPDANAVLEVHVCAAGHRQTLPANSLRLLDVPCNTSAGGITIKPIAELDQLNRTWRSMTPRNDVRHFSYDDKYPKYFDLFPPPAAGHQIDVAYSVSPQPIVIRNFDTDNAVIGIDDVYQNAIEAYIVYRALSKETEEAGVAALAQQAWNEFLTELGQKTEADTAASPNNG